MKKGIIGVSFVILIILSSLSIVGCQKESFDPFTSTLSIDGEKRMLSVSGNSAGHTAGKPSEFQLRLDNRSGKDSWQGEYCILLIDRKGILAEITHELFDIQAGWETQTPLKVDFPEDFEGSIGLCAVILQQASLVTTLWVGEKSAGSAGPWPNINNCLHSLTEEGNRDLAGDFAEDRPTRCVDSIEQSWKLNSTRHLVTLD